MMDTTRFTEVAQEAFATAKNDEVLIETIEVFHPSLSFRTKDLDLCFVVDNSGSQDANIATIRLLVGQLAVDLAEEFENIRYSLIQFKDEDETTIVTGPTFVDLATFQVAINALTSGGGGDARENGFGAIKLGCDELPWTYLPGSKRAMFLITDERSHERGATELEAAEALSAADVVFAFNDEDRGGSSYESLALNSGGVEITSNDLATVKAELLDLLLSLVEIATQEPLYLVKERIPFVLTLENGDQKTFEPCGFKLELPEKSDTGIQDLNIAIDNTNGVVTDFLERALEVQNQSIQIIYRPYLSSDLTQPQMDPPLVLYLSNASSRGSEVVGTASFTDAINKTFLSENYTLERFPALQ